MLWSSPCERSWNHWSNLEPQKQTNTFGDWETISDGSIWFYMIYGLLESTYLCCIWSIDSHIVRYWRSQHLNVGHIFETNEVWTQTRSRVGTLVHLILGQNPAWWMDVYPIQVGFDPRLTSENHPACWDSSCHHPISQLLSRMDRHCPYIADLYCMDVGGFGTVNIITGYYGNIYSKLWPISTTVDQLMILSCFSIYIYGEDMDSRY